jgi:hypothetical protein
MPELPKLVNSETEVAATIQARADRPKILLIDMEPEVSEILRSDWSNIALGTFGPIYQVAKSENRLPALVNRASLPGDFAESEIVVFNLKPKSITVPLHSETTGPHDFWANPISDTSILDPFT